MPRTSAIDNYHGRLRERLKGEFPFGAVTAGDRTQLTFRTAEADIDDWKRIARKGLRFHLVLAVDNWNETVQSALGFVLPVLPVGTYDGDVQAWASWIEEWECLDQHIFGLVGVSWLFFAGATLQDSVQILRAEWDDVVRRGGKAGQPHWHVDPVLPLHTNSRFELPFGLDPEDSEVEGCVYIADALQQPGEYQSIPLGLKRSGIHLAMAGWLLPKTNVRCEVGSVDPKVTSNWQLPVTGDFSTLIKWAVETLRYVRQELGHVSIEYGIWS